MYRAGLAACPGEAVLWYSFGVLEADRGQVREALDAYCNAVARDADFADAHYNLARLYAAVGKSQDALRAYNDYRRLQRES